MPTVTSPPLLLLLLLLTLTATSLPHHQTLILTPLAGTPPPTADPLAGTLTLYPSDPTLHLSHRDSLLSSSSSPSDLLLLRLSRDAARAQSLSSAARRRSGFSSVVVSGLAQGSGEYFARVGIGSPPTFSYMVLDTGSDLVWVQCRPCRKCYAQSDPIFNPNRSSSFSAVGCSSPACRRLDVSGCDVRRKSCLYQVSYGDGSVTTGELCKETLTFRYGVKLNNVTLGCGHDNEGLFVAASGLLGLGRGSMSFPAQAGRRFSYCLVDRTSANAPNRTSVVVFGDAAVPRASKRVAYTPMLQNPKVETFYYVEITGLSVGGKRVTGPFLSSLKLDPSSGRGGVIVDSGTSVTRLARPAYEALRDAFKTGAATELNRTVGGFSLFDTCYDLSGKTEVKVPTVALHLAGGGAVRLPAENYLIPVDTKGTFCFAFAGTESGVSIIGNIQQQGFRVVFDGEKSRIGFVPQGC